MDFKYECLPNYCLICGYMGHPTRMCRDSLDRVAAVGVGGRTDDYVLWFLMRYQIYVVIHFG